MKDISIVSPATASKLHPIRSNDVANTLNAQEAALIQSFRRMDATYRTSLLSGAMALAARASRPSLRLIAGGAE